MIHPTIAEAIEEMPQAQVRFDIGSKVQRIAEKLVGSGENRHNEIGEVVEIEGSRRRVLWEGDPTATGGSNYNKPKRTWMNIKALKSA